MTPREEALWKGAIEELVEHNLLRDTNYKGEMFKLTKQGYDVADRIKSRNK